jgi:iron complex transport system permease protein
MLRKPMVFIALIALGVGACTAGMVLGHGDLGDPGLRATLLELRASRVAVAFLAGAALSVAGVFVQGLFRNPLASPSILGTTAGASLGGQIAIMLFELLMAGTLARVIAPEMFLSLGCIAGALAALVLLMAIAGRRRDLIVLLLTGFILSSLFLSLGAFLLSLAQDSWELGRAVVAFSLGGVGGSGPRQVALALPLVVVGVAAAWMWSRPLDVLLSGEEEAQSLGVDVDEVRRWCVIWTAILTAGAVAVGGNVGFVGLVVPHAMRPFVGVEHRGLMPAAALAGGAFLVICDVLARLPEREIPLGVITGLIGAPVFLALLVRARRQGAYG